MRRTGCAFLWKNACATIANANTCGLNSAAAKVSCKITFDFIAVHWNQANKMRKVWHPFLLTRHKTHMPRDFVESFLFQPPSSAEACYCSRGGRNSRYYQVLVPSVWSLSYFTSSLSIFWTPVEDAAACGSVCQKNTPHEAQVGSIMVAGSMTNLRFGRGSAKTCKSLSPSRPSAETA